MTKSRGILSKRMRWVRPQLYMLFWLYADTPTKKIADLLGRDLYCVYRKAADLGLKKSASYLSSDEAHRLRGDVGAHYRFKKGQLPPNAGVKGWDAGGRSHETRFKKGQIPLTWRPIGSHRIDPDGMLSRKVSEQGRGSQRWCPVHRLVWVEHHGPVPERHIVVFKPGRRTTVLEEITLDRLELVSYAENMRRNSYHNKYPKEVGQLIQLRGALNRQINRRERAQREDQDR